MISTDAQLLELGDSEVMSLQSIEKEWIARRIQQHGAALRDHPAWRDRLHHEIDNLLWSYSVDGSINGRIGKDAWVASGARLREVHFRRVPHSTDAWEKMRAGEHKQVRREHIVPRAYLRSISVRVKGIAELIRVLDAYARVALVTSTEAKRLRPASAMPKVWDEQVSWERPPQTLPDPWLRYRVATPPVCPRWSDGQLAW